MTIQPIHEQSFTKNLKAGQNGFIVGEHNPNLIHQFDKLNYANWVTAIIANKLRARYETLENYLNSLGEIRPSLKEKIRFTIDELIMNAELHGNSDSPILLSIHRLQDGFWINCKDKGGRFKIQAAESLYFTIFEEKLTPSFDGLGAGIGLGMITKMSSQIHIRCIKGKETIVSCYVPDHSPKELKSFSYITD